MAHDTLFNHSIDYTHINDEERVHVSVAIGLSSFSFLVALVPIFVYLCHRERKLIWSHYNNLIIGCILVQLLQTAARMTASIVLLMEQMDETLCKGFSALEASFDTSCLVLLLGFYYSLMAVRWNPIRFIIQTLCVSCCGSDRTYQRLRHFAWFIGASGVAAVTGYFTVNEDTRFGFVLGWCTGYGSSWVFMLTNLAPLVLLVTAAVLTMFSLRCCVNADGGKGIAQELTWRGHWTIYVRFFAVIVFFLAAIVSTVVLHFLFVNDPDRRQKSFSYLPVVILTVWPAILSITFLLTEGILHYVGQTYCGVAVDGRRHYGGETPEAKGLDAPSAVYSSPHFSLPNMGPRRDSYGGMSSSASPRAAYHADASKASPRADVESNCGAPILTGGINNFTAAVNALLSLENIGQMGRYQTMQEQEAEDERLGVERRDTICSRIESTVYDGHSMRGDTRDDGRYSEIDDTRYQSASLADGFTPPARSLPPYSR
jgi:hypothetical protein